MTKQRTRKTPTPIYSLSLEFLIWINRCLVQIQPYLYKVNRHVSQQLAIIYLTMLTVSDVFHVFFSFSFEVSLFYLKSNIDLSKNNKLREIFYFRKFSWRNWQHIRMDLESVLLICIFVARWFIVIIRKVCSNIKSKMRMLWKQKLESKIPWLASFTLAWKWWKYLLTTASYEILAHFHCELNFRTKYFIKNGLIFFDVYVCEPIWPVVSQWINSLTVYMPASSVNGLVFVLTLNNKITIVAPITKLHSFGFHRKRVKNGKKSSIGNKKKHFIIYILLWRMYKEITGIEQAGKQNSLNKYSKSNDANWIKRNRWIFLRWTLT